MQYTRRVEGQKYIIEVQATVMDIMNLRMIQEGDGMRCGYSYPGRVWNATTSRGNRPIPMTETDLKWFKKAKLVSRRRLRYHVSREGEYLINHFVPEQPKIEVDE